MKIIGLVCEFNPFHNGHLYFVKNIKEICQADFLVAIMSGNYVQRGEPAILDKFTRTKMAIQNGIDLVLELPINFSTSSAQYFSYGAIKTLCASSIINGISFGCETPNLNIIKKIADTKRRFDIKNKMSGGKSYVSAFQDHINSVAPELNDFLLPNNILASEYIYSLEEIGWQPEICIIGREISQHHDYKLNKNNEIASGRAIRKAIKNHMDVSKFVPKNCHNILRQLSQNKIACGDIDNASQVFHYLISHKNLTDNILGVNEGLDNRIIKSSQQKFLISDVIKTCNCRRYTDSRLSRAILHLILDMKKNQFSFEPSYIRVLGFKKSSQQLLKMIKENSSLPLITNLKSVNLIDQCIKKEIMATDIYFNTFCNNHNFFPNNYEYTQPLVII